MVVVVVVVVVIGVTRMLRTVIGNDSNNVVLEGQGCRVAASKNHSDWHDSSGGGLYAFHPHDLLEGSREHGNMYIQ